MSALREILAHFSIEVDSKKLEEGNISIGEGIEKLKKYGEAVLGAFAVREVYEFIHGLTEQAEALEQQAQAFGMSIEEMNQWNGAAKIAGVQGDALNAALRVMAKNVGNATSPAVAALQKLGVAVRDSSGQVRPLTDLFEDAGAAIGTMQNAGERAAAGTAVFGRGFQRIIPLISQGREGMAKLRQEVEELGGGMDEAFVEKSKEVNAQTQKLGILFTSLKVTIAAELLPAVVWLAQKMIEVGKPILDLVKHTSSLQAAAVMAGGAIVAMIAEAIVPLALGAASLAAQMLPVIIAFELIEDFITFLRGGDSVTGRFIDKIFGKGAAKDVRTFLTTVFSSWDSFKDRVLAVFGYMNLGWVAAMTEIFGFGKHVIAMLEDAFEGMWQGVLNGAARALGHLPGMSDKVKELQDEAKQLADHQAKGGYAAEADHALNDKRLSLADRGEQLKNQIYKPAASSVGDVVNAVRFLTAPQHASAPSSRGQGSTTHHTKVEVNVHVPPGTPHEQARRVAEAAAKGAQQGTETARAKHAALNPGKG